MRTGTPRARVGAWYLDWLDAHSAVYFAQGKRGDSYRMWHHDVVYQFASPSKRRQKFVAGSEKCEIKGEADVRKLDHAVGD